MIHWKTSFLAAPLSVTNGPLGCRGIPVGNGIPLDVSVKRKAPRASTLVGYLFLAGSQTQIAPRAKWGLIKQPRATLWRRHNNGRTCTLLETVFASYFLRKKIMRMGNSFLAVSTFVWKELVHSLAEHFQTPVNKANNVNVLITVFENSQKTARPACLRPLVQLAARLLWFSPILLLFSAFSGNFPFYRHVTNVTDLFLNSRLRKVEVFIPQIDSHHLKNWYKNLKTFTSQGNWTSLLPAAVHCSFAPLFHLLQRIAAHLQRVPLWVSRET